MSRMHTYLVHTASLYGKLDHGKRSVAGEHRPSGYRILPIMIDHRHALGIERLSTYHGA